MNLPKVTRNFPSTFNVFVAKQELYKALLALPPNQLSDNETDIMYLLSKDDEIQKALEEKFSANRKENVNG